MPERHMSDSLLFSASPVKMKLLAPLFSLIATELLLLSSVSMEAGDRMVKLPVPKENSVPTDGCCGVRPSCSTALIKDS